MNAWLDAKHTALVIIDMQNDFCHEEGASAKGGFANIATFQACVPKIETLIDAARSAGATVVFVHMTLDESTISQAWRNKIASDLKIVEKGSWGADYYKLYPQEGDPIVEKHRFSAFIGTNLDLILRSKSIQSIVVTGVLTNVCVESTARDGFMMDYNVTMASDAVAGSSPAAHQATLDNFAAVFGKVMATDEIASYWANEAVLAGR